MKVNSTDDLVTGSDEMPPKNFKDMSNAERVKFAREVITIEPVVLTYIIAVHICSVALRSLEIEKSCKSDAGIADHICDAIVLGVHGNYSEENTRQQEVLANMNTWAQPAQNVIPIVLVIFLGSFSDRHKIRKLFIIIPLFGELLAVIGCIINWYYMKQLPILWLFLMNSLISSLFGNLTLLTMAVYAYIADNSTVEMRTLRVGVIVFTTKVFGTIASYAKGPLFAAIGYLGVFVLTWILILIAFLYAIFFVREKNYVKAGSKLELCKDILNPNDFISTILILVKKTVGCNRVFVILLLLMFLLQTIATTGPLHIFGLFTQKVFLWSPVEMAYYEAISGTLSIIGTSLGLFLFTKLFNLSDYNIVNITLLLSSISDIIFAFSTNAVPYYVGTVVAMFGPMMHIGIRSISTKVSTDEHVGKIQSLMAVIESIAISISAQFNLIYIETANTFPGTVYLISALFNCFTGAVVLTLNVLIMRKENKKSNDADSTNNDLGTNGMQMATTHI